MGVFNYVDWSVLLCSRAEKVKKGVAHVPLVLGRVKFAQSQKVFLEPLQLQRRHLLEHFVRLRAAGQARHGITNVDV